MDLPNLTEIASKEDASKILSQMVSDAMKLVRHSEKLARKFELEFSFDVAYGMGGQFYGFDPRGEYMDEEELADLRYYPDPDRMGWQTSSMNC